MATWQMRSSLGSRRVMSVTAFGRSSLYSFPYLPGRPLFSPLFTACGVECLSGYLEIPSTPGPEVCSFCHRERCREARKEVAVVLAFRHTLRAHEALGRPDTLSGFLEVVHRLFQDGVFVGHEKSIRVAILRSLECFAFSRERLRPTLA
jgi:hypothetical protein